MIDQISYPCVEKDCKGDLRKHLAEHLYRCSVSKNLFIRKDNEFFAWSKKLNFDCK